MKAESFIFFATNVIICFEKILEVNMILDLIKVIFLGIIEGLTEFLPVSSTGHLIIADSFIKLEPKAFSNPLVSSSNLVPS